MNTLKYRPEVDGLRAFAVIPVVIFHLRAKMLSGGFLGVDVFFVISGFLITSLILNNLRAGDFTFAGFYIRRIRRIAPAVTVMILGTLAASYFLVFRPQLEPVRKDAIAAALSFANFNYLLNFGDYWGQAAESSLFLHTWSLSVEEQFYFVYPAFLFLLWKLRAPIGKVMAATIALSIALFCYCSIKHPDFAFYMLPTRAWELGAGGPCLRPLA
jgi:peptidoglycan/LPS O-acetylase OafA/YrhL